MNYKVCISTDKGIVKQVNQDATMVKVASTSSYGRIVMGVLCDGMGGLSHGEVASATAIEGFAHWFVTDLPRALTRENSTERLNFLINKCCSLITALKHSVSVKISVLDGFKLHKSESVTHTVECDHTSCS